MTAAYLACQAPSLQWEESHQCCSWYKYVETVASGCWTFLIEQERGYRRPGVRGCWRAAPFSSWTLSEFFCCWCNWATQQEQRACTFSGTQQCTQHQQSSTKLKSLANDFHFCSSFVCRKINFRSCSSFVCRKINFHYCCVFYFISSGHMHPLI